MTATAQPASRPRRVTSRDLALIAVFAAFIAVLGVPGAITVPGVAVPITAQTLGVILAACVIGPWRAAAAVATFLVLVAAGLPLLSGGRGGLTWLTSAPSTGYLYGWILGALVAGLVLKAWGGRPIPLGWFFVAAAAGTIAIYVLGVPGLVVFGDVPFSKAFSGNLTFVPGDALKAFSAAVVAGGVHRGYPALLARRRATPAAVSAGVAAEETSAP